MNVGLTELKQKLELVKYSKAGHVKRERYITDLSMAINIIERLLDELKGGITFEYALRKTQGESGGEHSERLLKVASDHGQD